MNCESLEKSSSVQYWNLGINIDIPKRAITTTEKILNDSAGIPESLTIVDRKSVKNVKLNMNPVITPNGRALPIWVVPMLEDKIIGSIGKMQGDKIVTTPAKKAKIISKIIIQNKGSQTAFVLYYHLIDCNNLSVWPPFHLVITSPWSSTWTKVCW